MWIQGQGKYYDTAFWQISGHRTPQNLKNFKIKILTKTKQKGMTVREWKDHRNGDFAGGFQWQEAVGR